MGERDNAGKRKIEKSYSRNRCNQENKNRLRKDYAQITEKARIRKQIKQGKNEIREGARGKADRIYKIR